MSTVLWCDVGQHPFPATQNGRTTMKVGQNVKNQWGGYQESDVVVDICAACAVDTGVKQLSEYTKSEKEQLREAYDVRKNTNGATPAMRALTEKTVSENESEIDKATRNGYDPKYVEWLQQENERLRDGQETEGYRPQHANEGSAGAGADQAG